MTKIDIFSGFLGAGKTTLIKKLITETYKGEKLVLIENEFGEIGIDGGFLQDAGIEITEMNSGCICCSLVGDFSRALAQVVSDYHPDRILIEPSGVGKLSDVLSAVLRANLEDAEVSALVTVVDAKKCKMYLKNFGEFFGDQVKVAKTVIFSHTDTATPAKLEEALQIVRGENPDAVIVTTPLAELTGEQLFAAISGAVSNRDLMEQTEAALKADHHHHHHHEHGEDCHCGCHDHDHEHHHHEHGEDCHCGCHDHDHEHHHHEHGEDCHCGCHDHDHEHHHHEHGEDCHCGCHDHDHEHHHHADEVFVSWGKETTKTFTEAEIKAVLDAFDADAEHCGMVLRAKGIVKGEAGQWIHFDYVPGESDIRFGTAALIGKLCVIGSKLNESHIEGLFGL